MQTTGTNHEARGIDIGFPELAVPSSLRHPRVARWPLNPDGLMERKS